jgi:VanZ family protein
MGLLFYTSSLPGDRIHLPPFPYSDKAVHACAYAILGLLISVRRPLRARWERTRIASGNALAGFDLRGLAVGMAYGLGDEIHQLFVPMRSYDYGDMAADALGVVIGICLFRWLAGRARPSRP